MLLPARSIAASEQQQQHQEEKEEEYEEAGHAMICIFHTLSRAST